MQMAGLGFQGVYSILYPDSKLGFFNRSLGSIVKNNLGISFTQNSFSKWHSPKLKLASILDVKLNQILIGYICFNAIINAISFLTGIYNSKKISSSAKVKSLLGCYLVTGAGNLMRNEFLKN